MGNNREEEYLMLSGIQHFQFCKRQWALIHIEQQWEENVRTIEGHYLHKKADNPFVREKRKEKRQIDCQRNANCISPAPSKWDL